MEATKTSKAFKAFLKALDYGRYILLSVFATMWAIVGLAILLMGDFHIINLIGIAGCFSIAWINWSIRRD
jgi:hypothetical protein